MSARSAATDCIFCRIVNGEIATEFIAESDHAVAFRDLSPQAPSHLLVVPRRHLGGIRDVDAEDTSLSAELFALANEVARREGLLDGGFRVVINDGPDAGQTVFHLHLHVLGGHRLREPLG